LSALRRDYGMSILLTTHDMEEADFLCDDLAILLNGEISVRGTPQELKEKTGKGATLDDVFVTVSGGTSQKGGNYRDVRHQRSTLKRLG
jgi:ABC-2 type transport system ATP-binding protein